MKKKVFFALTLIMVGIMAVGCGSQEKISTTQAGQRNTGNEQAYGMEAKAPKSRTEKVEKETDSTVSENRDRKLMSEQEDKDTGTAAGQESKDIGTTEAGETDKDADVGLTETQAKEKALQDAGVSEDDITGIRIRKEKDDGQDIYDVEFYVEQQEYDYEIDILTGKVLEKDHDIDDDFAHSISGGSEKMISQEEAVAIVLEKVNGASAEHVFIELEEDDGQWKYEGEIHYNQQEYEFEVNAMNGTILEWSEEGIDD